MMYELALKLRDRLSKIKVVALKYDVRNTFDSLEKLLLRKNMMINEFKKRKDTLVVVIPHPMLLSRGEWLGIGVAKILGADMIRVKPFSIRPLFAFPIYNVLVLISVLAGIVKEKSRYTIAFVFNLFAFYAIYFLKKLGLIRFVVYDDADYLPAFSNGAISAKLVREIERFAISKSDCVISASWNLATLRRKVNNNVLVVENGVSMRLCAENLKEKLYDFIYIGYLDPSYSNLGVVIQAVEKSPLLRNAVFCFCGMANNIDELKKRMKSLGNVNLDSASEVTELASILNKAAIGIALYNLKSSATLGDPLKIKEYLAAGLCLVLSNIKPIVDFVKSVEGCFYVVCDPRDVNQVAEVLETAYIEYTSKRDKILIQTHKARKIICEQYNWYRLALKYINKSLFILRGSRSHG